MLSQERLREVLFYDKEKGIFLWNIDTFLGRARFGKVAGSLSNEGYVLISIDKKRYLAHRLAWLYVTGKWPQEYIDHKNTIRSDNRWNNLREASKIQNGGNRKRTKNKKSGLPKGVYKHENNYRAQLVGRKEGKNLGTYKSIEEAVQAYEKAAKKHFGEFYRPD